MSMILSKCLFLVLWLVRIYCEGDQERPKIINLNGHLILEAAKDKNIYIRVNGPKSGVFVQEINLLHLSVTNSVEQYETSDNLQKYIDGQNGLLARIEILENQIKATPYGIITNITLLMRRVNRLNNRLSMLQSQISRLKDECQSAPCQNGGTCLNLANGRYCLCPNNWKGLNCDVDVNECRNFAGTDLGCQNGATCINRPGTYECLCSSGWFGLHCTRRAKDCSAGNFEMCGYGTCVLITSGEGIKCICNQGWETNATGVACLTDVNECDSSRGPRCSANPKVDCINLPGTFRCGQCPPGYEGDGFSCHDINECSTIPNGGCSPLVTCHNTIGSRICGPCPPDYQGDGSTCTWRGSCNINNGGCHPSAQCIESMGVVQCICPSEMDGDGKGIYGCYISMYANSTQHCETNPCGINGRCYPLVTGYTCLCLQGYSGVHCEVLADYCSSHPCQNGGTCRQEERSIGFRCECRAEYSGHLCQLRAKSCSGVLDAEEGSLVYPLHNNTYDHNIKCAWVIHTVPNKVLNITFSRFNIELAPECMYDFLQIHDGRTSSSQLIGRFCGSEGPKGGNIVSSHNNLYLWFRSDKSVAKEGFALHWTSIEPVCGGEINATTHGSINSPGSPGKYPPNRDCFWHLATSFGKRIQLHFFALDIEKHSNCSFDYLAIYDGEHTTDPLISKYCDSTQPSPIESASSEMLVHFHSDAYGSGNGFQISYAPIPGIPGCGGEYNIDKGDIVSPSFNGVYLNNLLCEYRISTRPNTKIRIHFKLFKLESARWCRSDYLKIYDGPSSDSKLVGKFCGETYPKSYTSTKNSLFLIFKTDHSVASDGFKIMFETVCEKTIFGESGVVTSPGYPNTYPENTVCEYIIVTTPGKAIQLTFIHFDIEDNRYFHCQYDNVEVRDGGNRNASLLGKYCGDIQHIPPPQTSTLNYLYLRFNSDMSVSGIGFYANYTSIETECGGVYRENTGLITHPSGDGSNLFYKNEQKCTWILIAPPGMFIKLNWNRFDIEKISHCNSDYLELIEIDDSNQNENLGKYCGTSSPPPLTTTTNRLMINFQSDENVRSSGFSLSYTFLDEKTHCGAVYVKSRGFIYSPGWPKLYEPNRDCTWTITVPIGQQIKLYISKFDLEQPIGGSCNLGDYLEIRNGLTENSPLIGKYCGSFQSRNITSISNKMYLRFHSDAYMAGYGFKIEWDGTVTGCGGVLTSPSGSISSPNYPGEYYENAECFYKIVASQGSKILIQFTDLELERTVDCRDDYVEVFDGRNEDAVRLGKYCHMRNSINLQTTGNIAFIKFRSDAYIVNKGFILNYDTICNVVITGKHGFIESPGYPDSYQLHMNCMWTINVPKGNKINVTFNHFDIHKNYRRTGFSFYGGSFSFPGLSDPECENDYLQWKETTDSQFSDHYCGTSPPRINGIVGNSLQIKFVSGSFMPQSGFQLEWVSYGCGGYLKNRDGNITLSKDIVSTGPLECEWLIESPVGTSITINFNLVYMFDTPNCASDAIEVFNGQTTNSPLLTKFCHQSNTTTLIRSTTNHMLIRFIKSSNLRDVFFYSNFHSWNSGCGGRIVSTSGTVHSKNYPKNYDNNHNCVWTILVPKNHRIELNFIDLDLYSDDDESCGDYIKIYQAEYISNLNYTDIICSNSQTKQIVSKSNVLSLQFITDYRGNAKGFKANFNATCGAIINATSDGVITNEKFISHSNMSCFWTILAPSLYQKITVTVTHLSLPKDIDIRTNRSCSSTFLRIRDGNDYSSPIVGEYCGRRVPPSVVSHGSALTIELGTYGAVISGQFSVHYTSFSNACGGTLTSEEGAIASPNFPQPYPINTDCEWTLATSPGNKVYILFETFNLQYSENCNQDYLEVRENNSGGSLIDVYCGNIIPTNTTFSSTLYLKFHSDNTESSTGFMIRYGFLHGNDISGLDSGDVASPLYPSKYEGAADYSWRITISSGTITLTISRLEILRRSESCTNYILIYDGYDDDASLIENICGLLNDENKIIVTSSNVVYIKLKLDETNTGALFLIHWKKTAGSYNEPLNDNVINCGVNYTKIILPGDFVNIDSPNFPRDYDSNSNCQWVFETLPGNHLTLRFRSFKLEESSSCNADSISIYKSEVLHEWSPVEEKTCLSEDVFKTYIASTYLKVVFVTDSTITAKGFQARITSVCGGTITNISGIVSPRWRDWQNNFMLQCDWLVKVRPGRLIKLEFQQFNITSNNGECSSFVVLHNGGSVESPLLGSGKYCGYPHEVKYDLSTSSNYLYLSYTSNDPARIFKTFKLWYEEKFDECGSRATLTAEHNLEIITSPNYPSIPAPYTECIWKFTGPPGEILRIDFDKIDLDEDISCRSEYIEVHDGLSELSPVKLRNCGSKIPQSIKTSNNAIYIKYLTQKPTPNNGFKANISIDICGGTIVARSGELTSPGYPHMPILKYGSVCVWRVRGSPFLSFSFQAQDIHLPDSETPCATNVTIEESLPIENTTPILKTYCSEDLHQDFDASVTTLTSYVTIKLHIAKPSEYSQFSVSRGFRFTFNSSAPKCGGEITTPEGFITTPNYPRDTGIPSCYWKITAPNENRRITLQFIDADIQRHKICIYNDKSDRSLLQYIPRGDYSSTTQIFESTSNMLAIYLWLGPNFGSHHRFKAKFDSNKPALCGGRISGLSGQFSSPNLDKSYTCQWKYNYNVLDSTATNISADVLLNTLYVKVHGNSSVNNIVCRYTDPKLNIKSIISSEAIEFNRDICSYSESEFRIPSSSVDFMATKHKEGSLYFNIHWKLQPCGGVVRATEDSFNILKVPYTNNDSIDCAWIVLVPDNKRLEIKLNGAFQLDCNEEFIKINPDISAYSTSIGDYCKDRMLEDPVLLKYSKIYIQYHSKPKNETNIKIYIKTIENQCGGYFMTYETVFESPNYPKSYIENQECVWELKTDIGSRISLEFIGRFAIELSFNCTKDVLIIYDWKYDAYNEVARLCGRNPPPPFNSTFNRMKVLWRTDNEIHLDGFQARWSRICGGNYTATNKEQFLYSPGYPFVYAGNLECTYNIYGLNKKIVLKFIEFELEESYPSCFNDNLTIIGDSTYHYQNDNIYCGKEVPPLISFKHIILILRTDAYMSNKGFKLSYKLSSCGGEIKDPGVISLEPAYSQDSYDDNLNCTWHIEAPDSKIVVLRFQFFDLETSSDCVSDYLAIYDGSYGIDDNRLSLICGNNNENSSLVVKSSQKNMLMLFHSDYRVGGRGFKIEVYFTYSSSVGCGGLIDLNTTSNYKLKSPLIGSKSVYENFLDCHWTIIAPKNLVIKLKFVSFHIAPCQNVNQTEVGFNNCDCDYVDIKDGIDPNDPATNKYCGHILPPDLISTGNSLSLILFTDGEINSKGFEVTLSTHTSVCGQGTYLMGSTTLSIRSPGYDTGAVPRGLHCAYSVIVNNTQSPTVHINIKNLDLEPVDSDLNQCMKDKLIISRFIRPQNFGKGYIKNWDARSYFDYPYIFDITVPQSSVTSTYAYCGLKKSIDLYFIGSVTVTLYTSPESASEHKGFEIDISETSLCNRNYTDSYGRIQNSYKYYTENLNDCDTLITAPENYTISVHFLKINPVVWDSDTFITIHDGDSTKSNILKTISVINYEAISVFSRGRNLLIHNHVVNTAYFFYDLVYVTTNKGPGCGGILHNVVGKITSPMYPEVYRRKTTCEWELETPSQTHLHLRFTEFDLGRACEQVYLALVDRKGKTISTYCSEAPADYKSDDNYVKVVFVTTLNNGGTGWVAQFSAVT